MILLRSIIMNLLMLLLLLWLPYWSQSFVIVPLTSPILSSPHHYDASSVTTMNRHQKRQREQLVSQNLLRIRTTTNDKNRCSTITTTKSLASYYHNSKFELLKLASSLSSSSIPSSSSTDNHNNDDKLPSTVTPILLTVLALIISEGISLSTLPLHLTSIGATPVQVGLCTSAFSIAQMLCCPFLINLSSRRGRRKTLSLCLIGAAISSTVICTASNTIPLIIAARFVSGVFAAAIPVAQAAVTDLVPPQMSVLALSRVSAASQTGLVIGPMVSAVVQGLLRQVGVSEPNLVRGVFASSALFAVLVLLIRGDVKDAVPVNVATVSKDKEDSVKTNKEAEKEKVDNATSGSDLNKVSAASGGGDDTEMMVSNDDKETNRFVQPLLRVIALAAGWSLTLSVAIYSLFASRFLGYGQSELSATYSSGAAAVIATQICIVPPLVKAIGEHMACTTGLYALSVGLAGMSLIRSMPWHVMLYLLIRVGQGITDTSTATLVARASAGKDERARNLGMIQSTRAGARIFTPVLSGSLFMRSCQQSFPRPGSLPYLMNAALALALSPLPLLLKRMEKKTEKK